VEIEQYISEAAKAISEGDKTYFKQLAKELYKQNDKKEVNKFLRELQNEAKTKAGQYDTTGLEEILADYFTIDGGREFTLKDLRTRPQDAEPTKTIANIPELLLTLEGFHAEFKDTIPSAKNIPKLIDSVKKLIEESPIKRIQPTISKEGYLRELGKLKVKVPANRSEIYDYWENVGSNWKRLEDAINDFVKNYKGDTSNLEQLTASLDGVFEQKEGKEKLIGYKLYAYVFETKAVDLTIPDNLNLVTTFLTEFGKAISAKEPEGRTHATGKRTEEGDLIGEMELEISEIEDIGEQIISVDPILADLYNKGIQKLPISEMEWARISRRIERMGKAVIGPVESNEMRQLLKFMEEFTDEVGVVQRHSYYLPYNESIHGASDVNDKMRNFLDALVDLIVDVKSTFQVTPSHAQRTKPGKALHPGGPTTMLQMTEAMGQDPKLGEGIRDEYKDLVMAIKDYLITPLESEFFYGEKPSFVKTSSYKELLREIKESPFAKFIEKTLEHGASHITPQDLDYIADLIKLMLPRSEVTFSASRMRTIKRAKDALDAIFENKEKNRELIGHVIYLNIGQAPKNIAEKYSQFEGEDVKDLHERYLEKKSSGEVYALEIIEDVLDSYEFRAELGIKDLAGRGDKQEGMTIAPKTLPVIDLKEHYVTNPELLNSAKGILNLLKEINKIDWVSMKLLYAHDMVRKMNGQAVYYAYHSLSNINDVDSVIETVDKGLSINDLIHIVNEVDSFSNIAKSFGIDEESVYLVKALCR